MSSVSMATSFAGCCAYDGPKSRNEAKPMKVTSATEGQTLILRHDSLHWAVMRVDAGMTADALNPPEN